MPLEKYGVLKGRPIKRRLASKKTTYYQILVEALGESWRIAVNVNGASWPSELLYHVDEDFAHPVINELGSLPVGFSSIARRAGGPALDYIRGDLFDFDKLRPWPYSKKGHNNDLNEKIDRHIMRAIEEPDAMLYAWGEPWGPEPKRRDYIFHFLPGRGVHDIHMNQGNVGYYVKNDGIWQDGGVMIHFPSTDQWVALFLSFQPQTRHTDDDTGHRIETSPEPAGNELELKTNCPDEPDGMVRIVGLLLQDEASESPERTVTLINATPTHLNMKGWVVLDYVRNRHELSGSIKAGEGRSFNLPKDFILPRAGGTMTLLNADGLKVNGVAWTARDTCRDGWTIVF